MREDAPQPPTSRSGAWRCCGLTLGCLLLLLSCDSESALHVLGRAPHPPSGTCEAPSEGSAKTKLPAKLGALCLSRSVPARAFGVGLPPLVTFCQGWLGTSCERFAPFRLQHAEVATYQSKVDASLLEVQSLKFENPSLAYGYFTRVVLQGEDPRRSVFTAFAAGAGAAQSQNEAVVVAGNQVISLRLVNPALPPLRVIVQAGVALPALARELLTALGEENLKPLEVRLLPAADSLPLAVDYEPEDILDVSGLGPGAVGYYARGAKRWRLAALDRGEEDAALDVVSTLRKFHGASVLKQAPFDALGFSARKDEERARSAWLLTRRAQRIYAIGDDDFARPMGQLRGDAEATQLSESEKILELGRFMRQAEEIRK